MKESFCIETISVMTSKISEKRCNVAISFFPEILHRLVLSRDCLSWNFRETKLCSVRTGLLLVSWTWIFPNQLTRWFNTRLPKEFLLRGKMIKEKVPSQKELGRKVFFSGDIALLSLITRVCLSLNFTCFLDVSNETSFPIIFF